MPKISVYKQACIYAEVAGVVILTSEEMDQGDILVVTEGNQKGVYINPNDREELEEE